MYLKYKFFSKYVRNKNVPVIFVLQGTYLNYTNLFYKKQQNYFYYNAMNT